MRLSSLEDLHVRLCRFARRMGHEASRLRCNRCLHRHAQPYRDAQPHGCTQLHPATHSIDMPINWDLSHAIRHRDFRGKRILHGDRVPGAARLGSSRVRGPEQGPALQSRIISHLRQPSGYPIPDH